MPLTTFGWSQQALNQFVWPPGLSARSHIETVSRKNEGSSSSQRSRKSKSQPAATKALRTPALRSLCYEVLEDRRFLSLSNTSLSAAQQSALSNGLQGLANWSSSLGQYGVVAQQLPIVDQSIGSALNINGILQNQLVSLLQSALTSASNSDAVVSAL
jgi:hypothetical protein